MKSPDQGMMGQMADQQSQATDYTQPNDENDPEHASAEKTFYSTNIAESLDEDKLKKIGEDCRQGFELDLQSRNHDFDTFWQSRLQVEYLTLPSGPGRAL